MSRAFLLYALLCALYVVSGALSPAHAQDTEISIEKAEAEAPAADNDHLSLPAYIIPTRSGFVPQDQDSPQTNKRRWARPADHAPAPVPAPASFPEQ
ncbi:MAG: hypothetical protein KJ667_04090 [Alphaproteobacteria bacterium]|nr:hypothetical protein [Alphaproteobacteria bacterium]